MTRKFAADDYDLNAGTIISSRRRSFSDLNCYFAASPATGELYDSRDADAVKQSVRNLVLTNFYERPFAAYKGANTRALLFENLTPFALAQIESDIRTAVEAYEPRARVLEIRASAGTGPNAVVATIIFQIVSTKERVVLDVQLKRLR